MKQHKIKQYNLEQEAIELKAKGLGRKRIAQELTALLATKGVNEMITEDAVRSYLKSEKEVRTKVLEGSEKYREKRLEDYFDLIEEMKQVRDLLWQTVDELKKQGKPEKIQAVASTILEQLKLVAKLLKQLSDSKITYKINYLEYAQRIGQYLPELEKQGYITIHKPIMREGGSGVK